MIPSFDHSGVLPPFLPGATPADDAAVSPYLTTLDTFVHRFSTSPARRAILQGFLQFRIALKSAGFTTGFQWLNGSFVEDVENLRGCPPNDLDLVTFAARPPHALDQAKWDAFVAANLRIFSPNATKAAFRCDAYFVDLNLDPPYVVKQTAYWFGLFSHQRGTSQWKGLVEISILEDETSLLAQLVP